MTTTLLAMHFDQPDMVQALATLTDDALDALEFGVIGLDEQCIVRRYNVFESKLAGLSKDRVIGNHLFVVVAPCMNNFLVAQRLEDALASSTSLDVTLDYVFTLRMKPKPVRLRLLSDASLPLRYVLVQRGP